MADSQRAAVTVALISIRTFRPLFFSRERESEFRCYSIVVGSEVIGTINDVECCVTVITQYLQSCFSSSTSDMNQMFCQITFVWRRFIHVCCLLVTSTVPQRISNGDICGGL